MVAVLPRTQSSTMPFAVAVTAVEQGMFATASVDSIMAASSICAKCRRLVLSGPRLPRGLPDCPF
jgi:hypothetical protein